MQDGKHQIGHFFLGIVVLTWGINFGIVKSAYQDLSPILGRSPLSSHLTGERRQPSPQKGGFILPDNSEKLH